MCTGSWLTGCVVLEPAGCAAGPTSSLAATVPSSFRSGAFFVDCILICGGFEFDGMLLVDCKSWKWWVNMWVSINNLRERISTSEQESLHSPHEEKQFAKPLRQYLSVNLQLPEGFATLVMVPTALVRPSLNTSLWSQCRYSGVLMKRKWTEALSPVRKQSLFIDRMVAVCLMLPQWTKCWIRGEM